MIHYKEIIKLFIKRNLLYFLILLVINSCASTNTQISKNEQNWVLKIPKREETFLTGSKFARCIDSFPLKEREEVIYQEVVKGNFPEFLRKLKPINVTFLGIDGIRHTGTYYVSTDYVSIGSDKDFLRMPMTPMTAQRIADFLNCSLITKKMSDDIYQQADVKLDPRPLTEKREDVSTFLKHNNIIEEQRKNYELGKLVAGIKKDVVITNRLKAKPNHVAIYGWHKLDATPIQPLTIVHINTYVDYSHGIRLVHKKMIVDEKEMQIEDVLKDPVLCNLVSDEGVIDFIRY
jgi:hypothetical protein